jgi:hypothetical protein
MTLSNPFLDFFQSLPSSFRRDPSLPISAAEMFSPDWLTLKAAIARHFSWAVPNEEAIMCVCKYATDVIEIGAGSGYWTWLMRQAGIAVAAFDVNPPPFTWSDVRRGDEHELFNNTMSTLFLCWPPWATVMAANSLAWHRGQYVVYVGEWMLGSADARFFALLTAKFEAIDTVRLPQWCLRDDRLIVFRRRGAPAI